MNDIERVERELFAVESEICRSRDTEIAEIDSLEDYAQFLRGVIFNLGQADND